MKSEYQNPDEPECGAACLAMLAGISLSAARNALFSDDPKPVGIKKMRTVLSRFGLRAKSKKAKNLSSKYLIQNLTGNALINGFALIKDGTDWEEVRHWMVWDYKCKCLRDPLGFSIPVRATSATIFE